ncbi:hypothetical protein [Nocardioides marinquilinus]|uniref:hypothetical protein n=1 Tax=Nocardioides marinquilinus TaxID=1210400 RepID=UPI0031F14E12
MRPHDAGATAARRRPSLVGCLLVGTVASGSLLWLSQILGTPTSTVVGVAPLPSVVGQQTLPVERTDDVLAGLVARATGGLRVQREGSLRTADGQSAEVVVRGAGGPGLVRVTLRRGLAGPLTCENSAAERRCRTTAAGGTVLVEQGTPARGAAWTAVVVTRPDGVRVRVQSFAGRDPRRDVGGRPALGVDQLETVAAAPRWR